MELGWSFEDMTKHLYYLIFLSTWIACAANIPNQTSILLDVGATSLTLTNSGTGGADQTLRFGPSSNQRVRVLLSPGVDIPPKATTTYTACADPCSVALNQN